MAALADALGIDRFDVEGISGGGPYSLACAYELQWRVIEAVVVAGMGPIDSAEATRKMKRSNRNLFRIAWIAPWLLRIPMGQMARALKKDAVGAMKKSAVELPAPDRAIIGNSELLDVFVADTVEAFRQGTRGPAWEGALYARPWGVPLQDSKVPVGFWQGEMDVNVPAEMARWQASQVPGARLTMIPGEGHISLAYHYLDKILRDAVTG